MYLLNSLQQTPRKCKMLEDLISTSKSLLQSEFGIMSFRTSFISQCSLFLFVFRETMIDHLDIISTTVHKESQEAKSQNSSTTSTSKNCSENIHMGINHFSCSDCSNSKKSSWTVE